MTKPAARDAAIDRVSPNDLMQRALDVGPLPMHVGALLVLDGDLELPVVRAAVGARLAALDRLRQRLVRTPPGCGRPVWVDAAPDLSTHVQAVACPAPGDEAALLDVAVRHYTAPLPDDRPLWRAVLVTGLAGGRSALLLVLHHTLTDGAGGLALLAALADDAPPPPDRPFPRPTPPWWALARDAWTERARSAAGIAGTFRALRPATTELGGGGRPRATPCSLLQPLRPELALRMCRVPLEPLRRTARAHGATVNDAVLAAVVRALGTVLERRGEAVESLVVSVPVTAREAGPSGTNRVGLMPVALPTRGDVVDLMAQVAAVTGPRKSTSRGSSTAVSRPVFRALAALGLLRPLVRRQTMVNTFVTNVRGPADHLRFAGAVVADVLPLGIVSGNVTVACTVLSYAGTLTVAVAAAPSACPDLDELQHALQANLSTLAA